MSEKNIRGGWGIVYTVVAGIGRSLSARVNFKNLAEKLSVYEIEKHKISHCYQQQKTTVHLVFTHIVLSSLICSQTAAARSGGTAPVTRAMILSLYEKKPKLDAIMIKIINYKEYKTLNI